MTNTLFIHNQLTKAEIIHLYGLFRNIYNYYTLSNGIDYISLQHFKETLLEINNTLNDSFIYAENDKIYFHLTYNTNDYVIIQPKNLVKSIRFFNYNLTSYFDTYPLKNYFSFIIAFSLLKIKHLPSTLIIDTFAVVPTFYNALYEQQNTNFSNHIKYLIKQLKRKMIEIEKYIK